MPTASDLQSLIQLGVAINGAIFAVSALRQPVVAREKAAIDALAEQYKLMQSVESVTDSRAWQPFKSSYLKLLANFNEHEAIIEKRDGQIQKAAFLAAIVSMAALVASAYFPTCEIGHVWVAALVVLTVGPSIGSVITNVSFVKNNLKENRVLREDMNGQLVTLRKLIPRE